LRGETVNQETGMGFKCGIVGLPNVGKSTLFNALTQTAAAQAANYPFCTIEPNVGEVAVPEPRLEKLAAVGGSKEIIPARMNFVDIAGLVEGASQGEGLGNKFLANIRETDAIIYVLRCFENDDITHVSGKVDPIADFEVVETELMLADMESLEKRKAGVVKKANSGDKEAKAQVALIDLALVELNAGRPARRAVISKDDTRAWNMLQLLTSKPVLFVANVDEDSAATGNEYSKRVEARAAEEGAACVVISAQIEAELALLDEPDRSEYLETLGLEEPGLTRLIHTGYDLLNLQTYFTVGPKEARAWTIRKGWSAPKAAGVIHGDFEKGFIRAETVAYKDYVEFGGEAGAKEAGKMRSEGKEYIVQDGDVMLFRFNV
jgi:GTP-binding protein YchF|tara:strand:+ start:1053 stop:2183 length:1131 start_codon:yes stop_codon:yes gene_type:complete